MEKLLPGIVFVILGGLAYAKAKDQTSADRGSDGAASVECTCPPGQQTDHDTEDKTKEKLHKMWFDRSAGYSGVLSPKSIPPRSLGEAVMMWDIVGYVDKCGIFCG